ncbi:protein of unknown function [Bartonella clarridgeiae 73]|uniref:Uncharacterized protein n=1 Tax=Bartonella clarridgeiae (strain CCUG 45776 / CIP 104772 / 73) TaxID=696125 RepID=E6YG03_BARC7|nr:protein of unknown function [Bartonella clarridgeiae 73]
METSVARKHIHDLKRMNVI